MIELEARKVAEGLLFGEGIRWLPDGTIVLSDMLGRRVVKVDPASGVVSGLLDVPEQPNGLVVLDDGAILVMSMFDRKVLELSADGAARVMADLEPITTGYLGDVVRSRTGRLYIDDVGTRVLHGDKPAPIGRVIHIPPGGSPRSVLENLAFPNGIAIAGDGERLYLTESFKKTIDIYRIAPDGALVEGRTLAQMEHPVDGLCLDEADGVWACMPSGGVIRRLDAGGASTHGVAIAGHEPIACALGGSGGATLCVTAIESLAGKNIFEEMMAKRVRASVFLVDAPYAKGDARP